MSIPKEGPGSPYKSIELRPPIPTRDSVKMLMELQAERADSYRKTIEETLVNMIEKVHQESSIQHQTYFENLAVQFQLQEQTMRARIRKNAERELRKQTNKIKENHRAAVFRARSA